MPFASSPHTETMAMPSGILIYNLSFEPQLLCIPAAASSHTEMKLGPWFDPSDEAGLGKINGLDSALCKASFPRAMWPLPPWQRETGAQH
jgi:hypothetical protein